MTGRRSTFSETQMSAGRSAITMPNGDNHKKHSARIGGLSLHVYGDSNAIARRARAGLEAKFRRQALEINPSLKGKSLDRKIELLKSLHYARMAAKSAKARSRSKRH